MIHYIYKITNLKPSDERLYYIGVKSSVNPETDNYMGTSKYLSEAMTKIGKRNFKKEILSIWDTRELALKEEIRLHNIYNVAVNNTFYNKAKQKTTGFDTTGVNLSETHKNKISNSLQTTIIDKKLGAITIGKKRALKTAKTRTKKGNFFNIIHIEKGLIRKRVSNAEIRKISQKLHSCDINSPFGYNANNQILSRIKNQGNEWLIGCYLLKVK